tara:strand:+ start:1851 stop:2378 length:528 start_codon:yes stop_codon:yes gene_type:complete
VDEVTFLLRLLSDRWSAAASALVSSGDIINSHVETPEFVDVRSLEPKKGRRIDADSKSIVVVFEDSSSTSYPTIDYAVRNEDFGFTIHIRVLHRRDFSTNTFSRDRLQSLYRITRYILEKNSLRPTVYVGGGTSGTIEDSAELIKLNSRSDSNDRGKKLLGYKLSVEMKRFGRNT